MTVVNTLVEGDTDEAVASKLIDGAGLSMGTCYGKKGCSYIEKTIAGFNRSARQSAYLVLVDLMDTRLPCPSAVISKWLPGRNQNLVVRVVVRELESWLLADAENISRFLGVSRSRIPQKPEELPDPKRALINIARYSQRKAIRDAIVPEQGGTAVTGILYVSEMKRFIYNDWNVESARQSAPSLDRCLLRLAELKKRLSLSGRA